MAIKGCLNLTEVSSNEHRSLPLNLRNVFTKLDYPELPLSY